MRHIFLVIFLRTSDANLPLDCFIRDGLCQKTWRCMAGKLDLEGKSHRLSQLMRQESSVFLQKSLGSHVICCNVTFLLTFFSFLTIASLRSSPPSEGAK